MRWLKRKTTATWHVLQQMWQRAESWFTRVRKDRPWFGHLVRAGLRYNDAKGSRLAPALTYRSFLAVFPVLLLAFSVLGFVLQGNAEATREVADYLERNLPTLRVEAIASRRLAAGIVGLIGVLVAGLLWVDELRSVVRTVWCKDEEPGSWWVAKLVDVVVMVILGVVLAASVAATFAFTAVTSALLASVGIPARGVGFQIVSVTLAIGTNVILVGLLLSFVPRLNMSLRRLWFPALLGGVTLEVLKQFAQLFDGYAVSNPAYALVATAVGLLLFFNFFNGLLLFCAATTATSTSGVVDDKPVPTFHGWRLLRRTAKRVSK